MSTTFFRITSQAIDPFKFDPRDKPKMAEHKKFQVDLFARAAAVSRKMRIFRRPKNDDGFVKSLSKADRDREKERNVKAMCQRNWHTI